MEERTFDITLQIERTKAIIDYHKHLTTVCTASMILVSAFYEKLFPHPTYRFLINFVVFGFLLSILGSMAVHTIYAAKFPPWKGGKPFENTIITLGTVLAWAGFTIGVLCIALFFLFNA